MTWLAIYGSGLWNTLPTPSFRVLAGEAISVIQAQAFLQLTVTPIAQTASASASSVSVFHFSRKSWKLETRNLKQEEEIKMITESYKKAHASHSEWNTLCGNLMIRLALQWASLFDSLKYCLFGNNVTKITYTISFMAIIWYNIYSLNRGVSLWKLEIK